MENAEWFDEKFYKGGTWEKGVCRIQPPSAYDDVSNHFKNIFPQGATMLDIGGGIGNRTQSRINAGFDAHCLDISQYAFDNSTLPKGKHLCFDMSDPTLPDRIGQYDIVNVERSVEYLPEMYAYTAFNNINKIAKKWICLSIMCIDHSSPWVAMACRPGRRNMQNKQYWEKLAEKFWNLNVEKSLEFRSKTDVSQDCWWIYEKP